MYNPYTLEGKTILVTGASTGIGRQVAIDCAKFGAKLVLSDLDDEKLKVVLGELEGDGHQSFACDLTIEEEIATLVENCPVLDGLSNNAGVSKSILMKFVSQKALNEAAAVNTFGPALLLQKLVRKKKFSKKSSVVFTTSVSGVFTVHYGDSVNAMSTGAINAFAKAAALDLGAQGIRVNCVNPSVIVTENTFAGALLTEDEIKEKQVFFPLNKRFGNPDDVSAPIIFLLSDASSWITGVKLPIDGGYTLL